MASKVKILMVLGNTGRGGSQAYVMNILRNIDRNFFHIDIAACWNEDGGFHEEMEELGCNIYFVPYFKVYNYLSYRKFWNNFLKAHNYDIIHAHATNSAYLYLSIAKKYGCKTIAHSHSAGYRGNWYQVIIKKVFARKVGRVADYWFACSAKAAIRLFGTSYLSFPNYYLIPNAINTNKYLYSHRIRESIRQQYNISPNIVLYGHVGSFSPPKNHSFLLEIFASIIKMNPNAMLMCCGDGPLLTYIKEKSDALKISNKVIFTGGVTDVPNYLMAMDKMIFPSLFEGFPVSIIEASATGLPVIMSDAITKEVIVTDIVESCSLSCNAYEWALKSEKMSAVTDRKSYNSIIEDSVFNMSTSIQTLMNIYKSLLNN